MTTMTRAQFDGRFTPGSLDELTRRASSEGVTLTAAQRGALGRADLDGNGVVGDSARERRAVWRAVDRFDHNGSAHSVSSRTGTGFRMAQGLAPGAPTRSDPPAGGGGGGGAPPAPAGEGGGTPRSVTVEAPRAAPPPADPVEREITSNNASAATLTRSADMLDRYRALPAERRTPDVEAAMRRMVDANQPLVDDAPGVRLAAPADDQTRRLLMSEHDYTAAAARFRESRAAAGF